LLQSNTRCCIAYAVNKGVAGNGGSNERDWMAVKRIFRYLKGSIDFGIPIPWWESQFIVFQMPTMGCVEETKCSTSEL